MAPSETIQKIVKLYKERTAKKAYTLTIQPELEPGIFDSKFGGLPYWDLSMPLPLDVNGHPMLLLAQINFDRAKTEKPLPSKGMLQFFIRADDDCFGADFDNESSEGFRVVYHETIDPTVTREQVAALGFPELDDEDVYSPVFRESVVTIREENACEPLSDLPQKKLFQEIALSQGVDYSGASLRKTMPEEDYDYLWTEISSGGHWMLGYPYFTQYDPRELGSPYDTLLLQIDSDYAGNEDYVMWGDSGVGNFFINHEKLEQLDFSDILYTWDCC